MSKIIIGLMIGIVIGLIAGYFVPHNLGREGFPEKNNNFQIDEETKNSITSFFESTSDANEISNYCDYNRMNCMYYCKNINSEHEICKTLQEFPGGEK